jgi:hypothetical protein
LRSPPARACPKRSPASATSCRRSLGSNSCSWRLDHAIGRAGDHVDRAGLDDGAHALGRRADGEVDEAVGVEVAGAQARAEGVARLGGVEHPGGVLVEEDRRRLEGEARGRAAQELDRAGAGEAVDRLAGDADGEVVLAVAVIVQAQEGRAVAVARAQARLRRRPGTCFRIFLEAPESPAGAPKTRWTMPALA